MLKILVAAGAAVAWAVAAGPVLADELSRTDVEEIVREYLNENPIVIYEAIEKHQARLAAEEEELQRAAIDEFYGTLVAEAPAVGAEAADAITVVEFFDYNCGYCKRSMEPILQVLESEPDVRFVFIEFPILAPSSATAARAALAADRQGRYFDFHQALMAHRGALTDTQVWEIADAIGLDVEQLTRDTQDASVAEALDRNAAMGEALGVRGTPFFLVNQKAYPGWLDEERLRDALADARAG